MLKQTAIHDIGPTRPAMTNLKDSVSAACLCIVSGTGRNVGKTELACRLIKKLSASQAVWGLKVSTVYPDEGIYHGNHHPDERLDSLVEETRHNSPKDTSRMLRAGAKRVFYLRATGDNLLAGYQRFIEQVPAWTPVVCESNSLAAVTKPGMLLLVSSASKNSPTKERARQLRPLADLEISSDGTSGFPELARISYHGQNWCLKA